MRPESDTEVESNQRPALLEREDCTLAAWYRSLYAPRTGGAYDSHHRTAGIAGCARGAAAAWLLAASAQQSAMPVIGWLSSASPDGFTERLRGFRQGLKDTG